jgi:Domain of unknown function (DUF4381)
MSRFFIYIILLLISVGSLHSQVPAETEDIRGPKAKVEIPLPEKPRLVLYYSLAGSLLALTLAAVLWQKHARKQILKTPSEVALAALAVLESNHGSQAAEAFANQVTQTVRRYIEAHLGMAAPRRTTEEFLADLARDGQSKVLGESEQLQKFLKSCDLAKFAGSELDNAKRGELVTAARKFINSTSKAIPT